MKHLLLLPALFFSFAVVADASSLAEAQRAFTTGDLATAKTKFEEVLKTDPKNVTARNYLRMIASAEEKNGGNRSDLKAQLQTISLPSLEFREATLGSALDYLRQQAEKLSDGKVKFTFVLHPGVEASTPLTLKLANIPFPEALRYVGDLTGVKFTVEAYAIAVTKA